MIHASYFDSETSNKPRPLVVTWEQIGIALSQVRTCPCTPETCPGSACEFKLGAAWSPAAYPEGAYRGKNNVGAVCALVLDIDHKSDGEIVEVLERLARYRYIAHTSHSDRPGDRCLRVVMALSAPVAGRDWERWRAAALTELDIEQSPDPKTKDASRLYFMPSRPTGAEYVFDTNEGEPLDTPGILAKAPLAEAPPPIALPGAVAVASSDAIKAAAVQLAAAWPARGRHYAFLALAGALAMHGWPEDAITELTTLVARLMPGCDDKAIRDRPIQARDSIAKVAAGEVVSGWGTLGQALTRPEVVGVVREGLGMRDSGETAMGMLFPQTVATSETPNPSVLESTGYPNLAALDIPRSLVGAPQPVGEPGTFEYELQRARYDLARVAGETPAGDAVKPFFIEAAELFATNYPPTPWLVQGLIPIGGVVGLIAEAKSAKSWMAIELAMSVASGTDALGRFTVPKATKTAYFFAEDLAMAIRTRLAAFARGRGVPADTLTRNLHVQPRGRTFKLTNDEDMARLVASCRMIGDLGFLVLDPLRNIHDAEENSSDEMADIFARLARIGTVLGCTILVVHHAKRSPKAKAHEQDENRPGADARGSSAIEGALDGIISLRNLAIKNGDVSTVICNDVLTMIKNAKSAGNFPLVLTITDHKDGTAECAIWSQEKPMGVIDRGDCDELMVRCLQQIGKFERLKKDALNEDIRVALKSKREFITIAMRDAEENAYVIPNMRGNRRWGWRLTDAGREFLATLEPPPTSTDAPNEPHLTLIDLSE